MKLRSLRYVGIVSLLVFLSGCGSPAVKYQAVTDDNRMSLEGATKFYLQGSWIVIGQEDGNQAAKDSSDNSKPSAGVSLTSNSAVQKLSDVRKLKAVVTPAPTSTLYAIQPQNTLINKTALTATYFDNSLLLKKVGFEYKNQTVQAIQAVGGVLVAAAPFLAFFSDTKEIDDHSALKIPAVIDATSPQWCMPLPIDKATPEWKYRLIPSQGACDGQVGVKPSAPDGAIEKNEFFSDTKEKSVFVTSSCRDIILEITNSKDDGKYNFPLTIADPNWLYTYTIPENGAVSLHSICGADIQAGADSSNDLVAFAAIQEIFKQAKAIKDAAK
ncbi:hypothetical protein PP715_17565 [Ralstonia solanacearum]|uniref:Lipoprotein n=2 Tax=Ralstonia solanacearum TaxID=305 RepID=F6G6Q2_RALS8|nr:hypothetical protein [Ralstonia solanacearum]AEG67597.1 conserved hypothetical protein [Ralstonia solanacearum Po82]MBB6586110.1 hypothetical protein [Ralstonia solanacearum]MCG3577627.1 hypothetical protein [Ralstonia solanacearum]MCL9842655.1 hypothetical protein [Ralstonia solanacearum]MDB0533927.1 hypothetical protein [Ralstonia solanacearum]